MGHQLNNKKQLRHNLATDAEATTISHRIKSKKQPLKGFRRNLATVAEKWIIANPAFGFDGLDLIFDYPHSNFVDQSQAYYEVYDLGCKEGGNLVTTGFTLNPIVDVTAGSVTDDATFDISGKT